MPVTKMMAVMTPTYERCPLCRTGFWDWSGGDIGVALLLHFRIDPAHRKAAGVKR
jgi:hypothetical protein